MAEKPKRYYWLRLQDNFFAQPRIKKLRKIAGGDTYTIIYLKLQLLSLKNGGVLFFDGVEDTIVEELALEIDEEVENVQVTFNYLIKQGLIEVSDDKVDLIETKALIDSETDVARRVRKHRKQRDLEEKPLQCNVIETNGNTEIELKIKKEIEIELKIYKDILSFWNQQQIVQHRRLTDVMKGRINSKLEDYTVDEIKQSILNYSYILQSDDYFLVYRWTLVEFLDRGFEKMLVWENAEKSYRKINVKVKSTNPYLEMQFDENGNLI